MRGREAAGSRSVLLIGSFQALALAELALQAAAFGQVLLLLADIVVELEVTRRIYELHHEGQLWLMLIL